MESTSVTINFPLKLLRYELKEYLEYNFKVYIKKEAKDIIIFGSPSDVALCQEHAEHFKNIDSQFLLHLNEYTKESMMIPSLKLFIQSKCKVLMTIENDVLYIFGQLCNSTCIYNYLCLYTNKLETDNISCLSEDDETNLNVICRILNITLPNYIQNQSKIFIYNILDHRDELFMQFTENQIESDDLLSKFENITILNEEECYQSTMEKNDKASETPINYLVSFLESSQDEPPKYRTMIIDGCDVAFSHGNQSEFSPIRIKIAVDYFLNRGHTNVYAMLPRLWQPQGGSIFIQMESSNHLKYTPSRVINKVRETSSDARFILDAAIATDGIVLSNSQYRDLLPIEKYGEVICKRLVPYSFVEDHIIIPDDPRGFYGPSLDEMLKLPNNNSKYATKRRHRKRIRQSHSLQIFSKTANNNQVYHSYNPAKLDLKGQQIDLYKKVNEVFPTHGNLIRRIIMNNPDVTDLNALVNFVIMDIQSK